MNKLEEILGIIGVIADLGGSLIPGGAAISKLTAYLLKIAQASVKAHEAITGQPFDLTKLHEIEHV